MVLLRIATVLMPCAASAAEPGGGDVPKTLQIKNAFGDLTVTFEGAFPSKDSMKELTGIATKNLGYLKAQMGEKLGEGKKGDTTWGKAWKGALGALADEADKGKLSYDELTKVVGEMRTTDDNIPDADITEENAKKWLGFAKTLKAQQDGDTQFVAETKTQRTFYTDKMNGKNNANGGGNNNANGGGNNTTSCFWDYWWLWLLVIPVVVLSAVLLGCYFFGKGKSVDDDESEDEEQVSKS